MKKNSILVKTVLMSTLTAATFSFTSCQDDALDLDTAPQMEQPITRAVAVNFNINDCEVMIDGNPSPAFNTNEWRKEQIVLLWTGENTGAHEVQYMKDGSFKTVGGYQPVTLPWATAQGVDTQCHIPNDILDATTPENGWAMVLNRCGYNQMNNENFIFLYNKYTGIMRVMFYMPEKFTSGNDHFWEFNVTQNMATHINWKYGIPADSKLNLAGIDGFQNGILHNAVTPWVNSWGDNGAVVPRTGWWSFDIDMSNYQPGHDISNDQLTLTMHSQDATSVTLFSTLQGKMEGNTTMRQQYEEKTSATSVNTSDGLTQFVGKAKNVVKGCVALYKKDIGDGLKALGEAFGLGGNVTAEVKKDEPMAFDGKVNMAFDGTVDTKGLLNKVAVTTGVPSPKISMSSFDVKNTHIGQGIWNLSKAPVIYLTDEIVKNEMYGSQFGCVWFFVPGSVDVILNPDVFPESQIEWWKVDAVPMARVSTGAAGTDKYRKALGLNARDAFAKQAKPNLKKDNFRLSDSYSPIFPGEGRELANYGQGLKNHAGMKYPVKLDNETVNGVTQRVFGYGKENCYILEPQLSTGNGIGWEDYDNFCMAPPVEINVQVTVKLKGIDKVIVLNRVYLPEIKFINATVENFAKLAKEIAIPNQGCKPKQIESDVFKHNVKHAEEKFARLTYNSGVGAMLVKLDLWQW